MTRHTQEQFKDTKKALETMGKSIDKLELNDSIKCLNFGRISNLKHIYEKILPIVNKYDGVIYGTTIGTSIKNKKVGIRKTDDLDVRFKTEKDRNGFVKDVMKAIGTKDYFVRNGFYGAVICRKSDKETIIDTHVREKGFNKKTAEGYTVTPKDTYITLKTKDKKEQKYCNVKGETYSVSAQKKYSAILYDLNVGHSENQQAQSKLKRIGKDAFDIRIYNADAYIKAFNKWEKETDPKKKEQLRKTINDLGRAILKFSAQKEILENRRIAEKKYIDNKMLDKRTFTSEARLNKERAIYNKLKRNSDLDLTKFGTQWIEAVPIIKRNKHKKSSTPFDVDVRNMF